MFPYLRRLCAQRTRIRSNIETALDMAIARALNLKGKVFFLPRKNFKLATKTDFWGCRISWTVMALITISTLHAGLLNFSPWLGQKRCWAQQDSKTKYESFDLAHRISPRSRAYAPAKQRKCKGRNFPAAFSLAVFSASAIKSVSTKGYCSPQQGYIVRKDIVRIQR
ncbi:MAG: hypothetical protein CMH60_01135 [Myxococcales bacterium]|nr:hypothetical protein [Myxococcales bacterium]